MPEKFLLLKPKMKIKYYACIMTKARRDYLTLTQGPLKSSFA